MVETTAMTDTSKESTEGQKNVNMKCPVCGFDCTDGLRDASTGQDKPVSDLDGLHAIVCGECACVLMYTAAARTLRLPTPQELMDTLTRVVKVNGDDVLLAPVMQAFVLSKSRKASLGEVMVAMMGLGVKHQKTMSWAG